MTRSLTLSMMMVVSLGLAACGARSTGVQTGVPTANGPIADACNTSTREGRNPEICGCAQITANAELTAADQRLAVSFFADPARAQQVRTSDRPRDDAFWTRYRAFLTRFERTCRAAR